MKKWNMIRWILGIPVIVLTLILVILICEPEKSGITRAAAAKSVALALLSPEELNAWEKTYGVVHCNIFPLQKLLMPFWFDGVIFDQNKRYH